MRDAFRRPDLRRLFAAGVLGFFVLGALQALYGPAFPSLVRRYAIGLDAAGWTVSAHFAGSFVTIALAGPLLARAGYRWPLTAGAATVAAGALSVALAPSWTWVLIGASLAGLGFGLVDVGLNLLVARSFPGRAAPVLNLLHAFFGLGAVAGPLAVAAAAGSLVAPMIGVVALAAVLVVLMLGMQEPERPEAGRGAVPWAAAGGFLLMFFLYVATEVGVGSWETVHLAPFLGERAAAANASLYWGALMVGRVLASPLSARVRPATLVLGSSLLAVVALAAAHVPAVAPFAYPLVGLAFAPIFPTGVAWLQRVFPRRAEVVTSAMLAAAALGPVATSGVIGWFVEGVGPSVVPTTLVVLAAAMSLVVGALWRSTRRL